MKTVRNSKILIGYNQFLNGESVATRRSFNLSSFEDFNKLVEAVMLYDRIVLLGDYALRDGPISSVLKKEGVIDTLSAGNLRDLTDRSEVKSTFNKSLRYIFGESALEAEEAQPASLLSNRISPNMFSQRCYNALAERVAEFGKKENASIDDLRVWFKEHIFDTRAEGGHFAYLARSLVYSAVADHEGIDYAPDFLRLPLSAMAFGKTSESIPKKLYDALSKRLESEVEALVLLGMPVAIFVPPFTAKLLNQAEGTKRLSTELLALREEFAPIRKSYSAFSSLLADPDVSIHHKMIARKKLFEDISGMIDHKDISSSLNLKILWDKLVGSEAGDGGISTKFSLSGAVSVLVDEFVKSRKKGRARALFDLWTDTVKMKSYSKLIEKSFGTTIDTRAVENLQSYSRAIQKLVGGAGPPNLK